MRRHVLSGAAILAVGYAAAGGLYWLLLNVPESNIPALVASLALAMAVVLVAGLATAAAAAVAQGSAVRRAIVMGLAALPQFVLGVGLLGLLIWGTGRLDSWWAGHRGEVDAVVVRYLRSDRTAALHASVHWVLWLAGWGLGLSWLGGLTAAAAHAERSANGRASIGAGLRAGVAAVPLAAVTAAVVLFVEGVWRLAYWRPRTLAASGELPFVALKLAFMYASLVVLAMIVLSALSRAARVRSVTTAVTGTPSTPPAGSPHLAP